MTNNDPTDNITPFDRVAFKNAISMVESSGGKYLSNSTSSAAGKYHFLYRYLQDVPELKGISKGEFIRNEKLQEQVMDMALDGKLKGFTNYIAYAKKLKDTYKTEHTLEELAALTHFLGAGGAKKQLASGDYKVPGRNATVDQYLGRFRKHYTGIDTLEKGLSFDKEEIKAQAPINEKVKDVIPEIAQPKRQIDKSLEFLSEEPDSELKQLAQQEEMKELQRQNDVIAKREAQERAYQEHIAKMSGPSAPVQETSYTAAPGQEQTDVISWLNKSNACGGKVKLGNGGSIQNNGVQELVRYANGGSHEENSLGGIPIGSSNGIMNTVEEGETQHGSYVFSDRIGMNNLYKNK